MHIQLAWRNVWRNPRRTVVILVAVVIGVWAMVFLGALMRGMADGMVENAISTLTGEIQVHREGYRRDPVIAHRIERPEPVREALEKTLPDGSRWTARVRVNAIINNARHSAGATLVGIDPTTEANVSFIGPSAVVEGRYLEADDANAALVGRALVSRFETELGHKLVVMSQGADGEIAARAFRIVGVFRAGMEATETGFVFVNRGAAQQMLNMGDAVSEISIILPDRDRVDTAADRLLAALPDWAEVHTWKEILSAISAYLEVFNGFMYLWYLVIFIAMGFGIVNTLLMAVFERMREFGVLKALGMKPLRIVGGILTESFLLLAVGTVIGNLAGGLSVLALARTGIDLSAMAEGAEYAGISRVVYPALAGRDVFIANAVVLGLGLVVSLYPAIKAARITPVRAMAYH